MYRDDISQPHQSSNNRQGTCCVHDVSVHHLWAWRPSNGHRDMDTHNMGVAQNLMSHHIMFHIMFHSFPVPQIGHNIIYNHLFYRPLDREHTDIQTTPLWSWFHCRASHHGPAWYHRRKTWWDPPLTASDGERLSRCSVPSLAAQTTWDHDGNPALTTSVAQIFGAVTRWQKLNDIVSFDDFSVFLLKATLGDPFLESSNMKFQHIVAEIQGRWQPKVQTRIDQAALVCNTINGIYHDLMGIFQ